VATASLVASENEGATLTLTYDTVSLLISQIVLDATNAQKPTFWEVLQNGVQVFPTSGQPLAIQPGNKDTWNTSGLGITMGTIQGHPVTPFGYELLTWT